MCNAPPAVCADWLLHTGDTVAADEVIAQIETDKVTMDVRAPAAGVIDEIKACPLCGTLPVATLHTLTAYPHAQVAKGDNVKVGQLVATFTQGAAGAAKQAAAAKPAATAAPQGAAAAGPAQSVVVPSMGAYICHELRKACVC